MTSGLRRYREYPEDSAQQSIALRVAGGNWVQKNHRYRPGALVAAGLRIQAMIHDASHPAVLSGDPLMERLQLLIATATTCAETLDDSEKATAARQLQKAALVADDIVARWSRVQRSRTVGLAALSLGRGRGTSHETAPWSPHQRTSTPAATLSPKRQNQT